MLLGNSGGDPHDRSDVRIVPPADAAKASDPISADPQVSTQAHETPAPSQITVYVTGEVANTGIYTVTAGQRLAHVIELAGGPTENADLNRINLASYLADAAHYRIPATGETVDATVGVEPVAMVPDGPGNAAAGPARKCADPIDINTATAECLETLPGIGAVRARSIVSYREEEGSFVTADGITAVPGIGDGIYGQIADLITVGSR